MDKKKQGSVVALVDVMDLYNKTVSRSGNFNDFLNQVVRCYTIASDVYYDQGKDAMARECKQMEKGLYDLLDNLGYYDSIHALFKEVMKDEGC